MKNKAIITLLAAALLSCAGQQQSNGKCPLEKAKTLLNTGITLDDRVNSEYDKTRTISDKLRREILNKTVEVKIRYSFDDDEDLEGTTFGIALKNNQVLTTGTLINMTHYEGKKISNRKIIIEGYDTEEIKTGKSLLKNYSLFKIVGCPEESCLDPFTGKISKTPASGDVVFIPGTNWINKKDLFYGEVKGTQKTMEVYPLFTIVETDFYKGGIGAPAFAAKTDQETGETTLYLTGIVQNTVGKKIIITCPQHLNEFLSTTNAGKHYPSE